MKKNFIEKIKNLEKVRNKTKGDVFLSGTLTIKMPEYGLDFRDMAFRESVKIVMKRFYTATPLPHIDISEKKVGAKKIWKAIYDKKVVPERLTVKNYTGGITLCRDDETIYDCYREEKRECLNCSEDEECPAWQYHLLENEKKRR